MSGPLISGPLIVMTGPGLVRTAGGVLQIVGVVGVVYEITAIRRTLFDQDPLPVRMYRTLCRRARALLVRLHVIAPRNVNLEGLTASVNLTANAGMVVTRADESQMSTEERLERHRSQLDDHERRLEAVGSDLQRESDARSVAIAEEAARMQSLHEELKALFTKLSGGSLRLRWWGALLILVGIACTTWPTGIAHFGAS